MFGWRLGVSNAEGSSSNRLGLRECRIGGLDSQGVFAAIGCDYDLLRLEGLMVLMNWMMGRYTS